MRSETLGMVLALKEASLHETQASITQWANETFGPARSNLSIAIRANSEMAELLRDLALSDHSEGAATEVADVMIVLYRLLDQLGTTLEAEVDKKMRINRGRKWKIDGSGHGKHL